MKGIKGSHNHFLNLSSSQESQLMDTVSTLTNSLISHMSKKQPTVALSTAEAEMHAALQASKEAIWQRHILNKLGYTQKNATTVYCDNQAAISLSRNPEYHSHHHFFFLISIQLSSS